MTTRITRTEAINIRITKKRRQMINDLMEWENKTLTDVVECALYDYYRKVTKKRNKEEKENTPD
jgi:uncharacterized protein (DUF1778 family)